MADYSINAVTRRVVYSGSAGVGPYAFTFEILDENDVAIYKNATRLTLTTDYTVTINGNGTGAVTLVSAASGSDRITIIGKRDIERTTDFATAGDLLAEALNEQLDSQIVMIQQLAEENRRTLKAPPYDDAAVEDGGTLNMTLPAKADRAGLSLAFDDDGNPTPGAPTADLIAAAASAAADADQTAADRAAVAADKLTVAGYKADAETARDEAVAAAESVGTPAPASAEFLVKSSNVSLSAERVVEDNTHITWDWSVSGVVKAVIAAASITAAEIADATITFAKMATAAIATAGEICANTADKIVSVAALWTANETYDLGNITGTVTLDLGAHTNFRGTMTGNVTFSVTNAKDGQSFSVWATQDGTGGRTISFSSSSQTWSPINATAPTWSTVASATNYLCAQVRKIGAGNPVMAYSGGKL